MPAWLRTLVGIAVCGSAVLAWSDPQTAYREGEEGEVEESDGMGLTTATEELERVMHADSNAMNAFRVDYCSQPSVSQIGDPEVCGFNPFGSTSLCWKARYSFARVVCSKAGGRLCRRREIKQGELLRTGCPGRVWTGTVCRKDSEGISFFATLGNSHLKGENCSKLGAGDGGQYNRHYTACCWDVKVSSFLSLAVPNSVTDNSIVSDLQGLTVSRRRARSAFVTVEVVSRTPLGGGTDMVVVKAWLQPGVLLGAVISAIGTAPFASTWTSVVNEPCFRTEDMCTVDQSSSCAFANSGCRSKFTVCECAASGLSLGEPSCARTGETALSVYPSGGEQSMSAMILLGSDQVSVKPSVTFDQEDINSLSGCKSARLLLDSSDPKVAHVAMTSSKIPVSMAVSIGESAQAPPSPVLGYAGKVTLMLSRPDSASWPEYAVDLSVTKTGGSVISSKAKGQVTDISCTANGPVRVSGRDSRDGKVSTFLSFSGVRRVSSFDVPPEALTVDTNCLEMRVEASLSETDEGSSTNTIGGRLHTSQVPMSGFPGPTAHGAALANSTSLSMVLDDDVLSGTVGFSSRIKPFSGLSSSSSASSPGTFPVEMELSGGLECKGGFSVAPASPSKNPPLSRDGALEGSGASCTLRVPGGSVLGNKVTASTALSSTLYVKKQVGGQERTLLGFTSVKGLPSVAHDLFSSSISVDPSGAAPPALSVSMSMSTSPVSATAEFDSQSKLPYCGAGVSLATRFAKNPQPASVVQDGRLDAVHGSSVSFFFPSPRAGAVENSSPATVSGFAELIAATADYTPADNRYLRSAASISYVNPSVDFSRYDPAREEPDVSIVQDNQLETATISAVLPPSKVVTNPKAPSVGSDFQLEASFIEFSSPGTPELSGTVGATRSLLQGRRALSGKRGRRGVKTKGKGSQQGNPSPNVRRMLGVALGKVVEYGAATIQHVADESPTGRVSMSARLPLTDAFLVGDTVDFNYSASLDFQVEDVSDDEELSSSSSGARRLEEAPELLPRNLLNRRLVLDGRRMLASKGGKSGKRKTKTKGKGSQEGVPSPNVRSSGNSGDPAESHMSVYCAEDSCGSSLTLYGGSSDVDIEFQVSESEPDSSVETLSSSAKVSSSWSSAVADRRLLSDTRDAVPCNNVGDGSLQVVQIAGSASLAAVTRIPSCDLVKHSDGTTLIDVNVAQTVSFVQPSTNTAYDVTSTATFAASQGSLEPGPSRLRRTLSSGLLGRSADAATIVDAGQVVSSAGIRDAESGSVRATVDSVKLSCKADGGFVAKPTPCASGQFSHLGQLFTGCVPIGTAPPPKLATFRFQPSLDSTSLAAWCPTKRTSTAEWGFCSCQPSGQRLAPTRKVRAEGTITDRSGLGGRKVSSLDEYVGIQHVSVVSDQATNRIDGLLGPGGGAVEDQVALLTVRTYGCDGASCDESINQLTETVATVTVPGQASSQRKRATRVLAAGDVTTVQELVLQAGGGAVLDPISGLVTGVSALVPVSGTDYAENQAIVTLLSDGTKLVADVGPKGGAQRPGTVAFTAALDGNFATSAKVLLDPPQDGEGPSSAGLSLRADLRPSSTRRDASTPGVLVAEFIAQSSLGPVSAAFGTDAQGKLTFSLEQENTETDGAKARSISVTLASLGSGDAVTQQIALDLTDTVLQVPRAPLRSAPITITSTADRSAFSFSYPVSGGMRTTVDLSFDGGNTKTSVSVDGFDAGRPQPFVVTVPLLPGLILGEPALEPVEAVPLPTPAPVSGEVVYSTRSPTPYQPGLSCSARTEAECKAFSGGSIRNPKCLWVQGTCSSTSDLCQEECSFCSLLFRADCQHSQANCAIVEDSPNDPYASEKIGHNGYATDDVDEITFGDGSMKGATQLYDYLTYSETVLNEERDVWTCVPRSRTPEEPGEQEPVLYEGCRDTGQAQSAVCSAAGSVVDCLKDTEDDRFLNGEGKLKGFAACPSQCSSTCLVQRNQINCLDVSDSFCKKAVENGCENVYKGFNTAQLCQNSCKGLNPVENCDLCQDRSAHCFGLVTYFIFGVFTGEKPTFSILGNAIYGRDYVDSGLRPCLDETPITSSGITIRQACPYACMTYSQADRARFTKCRHGSMFRRFPLQDMRPPCAAVDGPPIATPPNGGRCVFPFVIAARGGQVSKKYTSCIDMSTSKPYAPAGLTLDTSRTWCPMVNSYDPSNSAIRSMWGYCDCPQYEFKVPSLETCPTEEFRAALNAHVGSSLEGNVGVLTRDGSGYVKILGREHALSLVLFTPVPSRGPCVYSLSISAGCDGEACNLVPGESGQFLPKYVYENDFRFSLQLRGARTDEAGGVNLQWSSEESSSRVLVRFVKPASAFQGTDSFVLGGLVKNPWLSLQVLDFERLERPGSLETINPYLRWGPEQQGTEASLHNTSFFIDPQQLPFTKWESNLRERSWSSATQHARAMVTWMPFNSGIYHLLHYIRANQENGQGFNYFSWTSAQRSAFCDVRFIKSGDLCSCKAIKCREHGLVMPAITELVIPSGVRMKRSDWSLLEYLMWFGLRKLDIRSVVIPDDDTSGVVNCLPLPGCKDPISAVFFPRGTATCLIPLGKRFCPVTCEGNDGIFKFCVLDQPTTQPTTTTTPTTDPPTTASPSGPPP